MIVLEPGDKIRSADHVGTCEPLPGKVLALAGIYVHVIYEEPTGISGIDIYYRESLWRAHDGDLRWRLELIRECPWCEHDISGPGEATPILYARLPQVNQNWQCTDLGGCERRQRALDEVIAASSFYPPVKYGPFPVAALETV